MTNRENETVIPWYLRATEPAFFAIGAVGSALHKVAAFHPHVRKKLAAAGAAIGNAAGEAKFGQ